MLDFLFYLVYSSVKLPNAKKWYNKFWFSPRKKELSRNAFAVLITLVYINVFLLISYPIKYFFRFINLDTFVVTAGISSFLLFIVLIFIIVPKRYTYNKINLIERKFGKIKRWQAIIIIIIIIMICSWLPLAVFKTSLD